MKQVKIQASLESIRKASPKAQTVKHEGFSTHSYAKVYYLGGGWWIVSGYHYAGKDTDESLAQIRG